MTAVDRWRPLQTATWGTAGHGREATNAAQAPGDGASSTAGRRECSAKHLPPRQPTEASARPARCEDELQGLDPARLVGNYAFCTIYPLFRRR
jgi:hypothetical protein